MHSPAPEAEEENTKEFIVEGTGNGSPANDEGEVHSDTEPCLGEVRHTLHEGVDEETEV